MAENKTNEGNGYIKVMEKMIRKILKKVLPLELCKRLNTFYTYHIIRSVMGYVKYSKLYRKTKNGVIYLIGTPTHPNLGDQAIAIAEIKYLKSVLPDYRIHEITDEDYYAQFFCLKRTISKQDKIILHGGGNMGIQYYSHEKIRLHVVKHFLNNKIIIFPQSVDYGKTSIGKRKMMKTVRIFQKHMDLHIIAREKYSYEILKKYFKNIDIIFVPDIVLTLDKQNSRVKRNKIILCLREDCERKLSDDVQNRLREYFSQKENVIEIDMTLDTRIEPDQRINILEKRWKLFQEARYVITDRLHGMIFSIITGTPCIVFENYNHKIKGVYLWLKDFCKDKDGKSVVYLVDSMLEVENIVGDMEREEYTFEYDNKIVWKEYDKVKNLLLKS